MRRRKRNSGANYLLSRRNTQIYLRVCVLCTLRAVSLAPKSTAAGRPFSTGAFFRGRGYSAASWPRAAPSPRISSCPRALVRHRPATPGAARATTGRPFSWRTGTIFMKSLVCFFFETAIQPPRGEALSLSRRGSVQKWARRVQRLSGEEVIRLRHVALFLSRLPVVARTAAFPGRPSVRRCAHRARRRIHWRVHPSRRARRSGRAEKPLSI